MGDPDAQARKARLERLIRAFSPGDRPPCSGWQAERKVFDIDRLVLGVAVYGFTAYEDTPMEVAAPGILANDNDADDDPLQIEIVTYPGGFVDVLSGNAAVNGIPVSVSPA